MERSMAKEYQEECPQEHRDHGRESLLLGPKDIIV